MLFVFLLLCVAVCFCVVAVLLLCCYCCCCCVRGGCVCVCLCVGPPGLHTTTRELQTCTFERTGASNTTKIPRKRPKERGKQNKTVAGEGKKARNFGPPPFGPPPFGPHNFGAPQLRGPTTSGFGPPPLGGPTLGGPHHDTKNIGQKIGLAKKLDWPKNWIGQNWIGQNWIGQNWFWPKLAGPKPRWPKMDWPKLDWPKLVKSGWPKRDWPKSVSSSGHGRAAKRIRQHCSSSLVDKSHQYTFQCLLCTREFSPLRQLQRPFRAPAHHVATVPSAASARSCVCSARLHQQQPLPSCECTATLGKFCFGHDTTSSGFRQQHSWHERGQLPRLCLLFHAARASAAS